MLRVKENANFTSRNLAAYLDQQGVGNRMLFGGNLTKQPVLLGLKKEFPHAYRVVSDLGGSDKLMNSSLFLGVFPGSREEGIRHVTDVLKQAVKLRP